MPEWAGDSESWGREQPGYAQAWLEETARCPACGGEMEPEEDPTTRWMACTDCGYENAYALVKSGDGCQLNIPAPARFAMGGVIPSNPGPHGDAVPVVLTQGHHIPIGPPS